MTTRKHVVYILTSSLAARRMFADHGRLWRSANLRVTVISSPGPDLTCFGVDEEVDTIGIPISRELSPWKDVIALYRLWRQLRLLHPDLVESGTPKAGLLGGIAARLARVPRLIYTLHGLRLETLHGWRRTLMRCSEKLCVRLADETVCVSHGLLQQARRLGVIPISEGIVAGPGSAGGIDTARFASVARTKAEGATIGFVGRITRDKGIVELIQAFHLVRKSRPDAQLLLVGDFEDGDPVPGDLRRHIAEDPAIRMTGFVDDATQYYGEIDVVALPSYREGFPLVALEAAAAARPIVATDCTGMSDAVCDGKTGILLRERDAETLASALLQLLNSPETAKAMGRAARGRVLRTFQPDVVWTEKLQIYRRLLAPRPGLRFNWQAIGKRAFDLAVASLLLAAIAPIVALVALFLLVFEGRPVFFRQLRPGLAQQPIVVQKFRTMSEERSADGSLLSDDERLTALGRFLRRWSIDELPQLWSVVRGDMSLVGPRPLLADYLPRYSHRQKRRFLVRPGLTGWAQIHGRNRVGWEKRLEMDVWYAENWSLWLDIRILVKTVGVVLTGCGVEAHDAATPSPFLGYYSDDPTRPI